MEQENAKKLKKFAKEVEKPMLDNVKILAAEYVDICNDISEIEQQLEDKLEALNKTEKTIIECGFSSIGLPTGEFLKVSNKVNATIADYESFAQSVRKYDVYKKIKHTFAFGDGPDEFFNKIAELSVKYKVDSESSFGLHHSSLRSFAQQEFEKEFQDKKDENEAIKSLERFEGLEAKLHKKVEVTLPHNKTKFKRRFKKS